MDYSRFEANPPHPFTEVESVATEDVLVHLEGAATKQMRRDRLARRVKDADDK
jgi:hypothetical protein